MMMKVFVTGASGFIGRHLCRVLAARGHQVTALVRRAERAPAGVAIAVGHLCRPADYRAALAGCDAVMHLAADYRLGPVDRRAMFATNVEGTRAILDAAPGRVVHVSSTAALGETGGREGDESQRHNGVFRSYYEETKHIAHGLAAARMAAGAPVAIAIPGGVFGAGDRSPLARALGDFVRGKLPIQVASQSRFNLCQVDAVCDGLARILEHGGAEAWILTGAATSMAELLALAAELTGRRPPRAVPARVLAAPARVLDLVSRLSGAALPLSREALAVMDGSSYIYSSARARARLGWDPGEVRPALADYLASLR